AGPGPRGARGPPQAAPRLPRQGGARHGAGGAPARRLPVARGLVAGRLLRAAPGLPELPPRSGALLSRARGDVRGRAGPQPRRHPARLRTGGGEVAFRVVLRPESSVSIGPRALVLSSLVAASACARHLPAPRVSLQEAAERARLDEAERCYEARLASTS